MYKYIITHMNEQVPVHLYSYEWLYTSIYIHTHMNEYMYQFIHTHMKEYVPVH